MCLEKDPLRRWTCDQLLRHPFFDNFSFKYPEGDLYEFEKLKTFREKSKNGHYVNIASTLFPQIPSNNQSPDLTRPLKVAQKHFDHLPDI
ncbi:cyclin-dependent kinase-like 4 [Aphis craccivora]|uniref:Cyclin-dependent kinase-like 4 n=4 Tax=Aphidini TaxID=33387 RepID=A0A6G0XDI7_APHCR|nr:cyclin-dependent kinase-like 4 [Aphis craccivora]